MVFVSDHATEALFKSCEFSEANGVGGFRVFPTTTNFVVIVEWYAGFFFVGGGFIEGGHDLVDGLFDVIGWGHDDGAAVVHE